MVARHNHISDLMILQATTMVVGNVIENFKIIQMPTLRADKIIPGGIHTSSLYDAQRCCFRFKNACCSGESPDMSPAPDDDGAAALTPPLSRALRSKNARCSGDNPSVDIGAGAGADGDEKDDVHADGAFFEPNRG